MAQPRCKHALAPWLGNTLTGEHGANLFGLWCRWHFLAAPTGPWIGCPRPPAGFPTASAPARWRWRVSGYVARRVRQRAGDARPHTDAFEHRCCVSPPRSRRRATSVSQRATRTHTCSFAALIACCLLSWLPIPGSSPPCLPPGPAGRRSLAKTIRIRGRDQPNSGKGFNFFFRCTRP